jgi:hypothetical protein
LVYVDRTRHDTGIRKIFGDKMARALQDPIKVLISVLFSCQE